MPKKLYNEGRVVGLSAFEIYAKQALATPGVTEVATEREWLASTIANGSSLLLQIPGGLTAGVYDIKLPSGSRLVSANTIIGSFAYGVESDSWENATTVQTISQKFRWAKRVTCYGNISKPPTSKQTSAKGMSNNNNTTATTNECTSEQMQYIKIIDGIVYQFGKWKLSSVENNDKIKTVPDDIQYDQTYVRLAFRDDIASNKSFCILLTGFTDLAVVYGVTGLEGDPTNISNNINDWKNGGFLGPSKFPWASKIWFATPGNLTYELKMGLSGAGHPNIKITSNKDTVDTKIEVMNNITSDKTAKFLKITAKDWNGNVLDPADDAAEIPYAAQHSLDIDGKALIEDILAPGIGTNIVDSTTDPKNSYGTTRKVIKTNINAPNASGITIDPLSSSSNAQGAQVQNISTNLVSDNGSGIDYENGTGTAKKIKTVLESGKGTGITISAGSGKAKKIVTNLSAGTGIQIGNKTGQEDSDTSKTIATNILVGNGLQINKLSSRDDTGAQTISHNLVNGTGVSIGTRAELGVSTTAITNNGTEAPTISGTVKPIAELKLHDTVRYDNTRFRWDGSKWLAQGKASNATTGRPTIIRTNIKAGVGIDVAPISSDDNSGAQTIKNQISGGQGIDIKSITPKVSTTEITNGGTENPTINGSRVDMSSIAYGSYYTVNYGDKRFRWDGSRWVSDGNSTAGNTNVVSTNIVAGDGISVSVDPSNPSRLQISNTKPNEATNSSNLSFDYNAGMRIQFFNNWDVKDAYKGENWFTEPIRGDMHYVPISVIPTWDPVTHKALTLRFVTDTLGPSYTETGYGIHYARYVSTSAENVRCVRGASTSYSNYWQGANFNNIIRPNATREQIASAYQEMCKSVNTLRKSLIFGLNFNSITDEYRYIYMHNNGTPSFSRASSRFTRLGGKPSVPTSLTPITNSGYQDPTIDGNVLTSRNRGNLVKYANDVFVWDIYTKNSVGKFGRWVKINLSDYGVTTADDLVENEINFVRYIDFDYIVGNGQTHDNKDLSGLTTYEVFDMKSFTPQPYPNNPLYLNTLKLYGQKYFIGMNERSSLDGTVLLGKRTSGSSFAPPFSLPTKLSCKARANCSPTYELDVVKRNSSGSAYGYGINEDGEVAIISRDNFYKDILPESSNKMFTLPAKGSTGSFIFDRYLEFGNERPKNETVADVPTLCDLNFFGVEYTSPIGTSAPWRVGEYIDPKVPWVVDDTSEYLMYELRVVLDVTARIIRYTIE